MNPSLERHIIQLVQTLNELANLHIERLKKDGQREPTDYTERTTDPVEEQARRVLEELL